MNIILLGPPGSGKSTQAKFLSEELGIPGISMGQVLRDSKKAKTILGLEAAKFVEEGKLVPARIMEALTRFRLEEDDCKGGFILDGAPRRVEEAVMFNDYLKRKRKKLDKVYVIEIPDEVAINRLLERFKLPEVQGGKRKDDNIEDIRVRLAEYHDNIDPVIVYYREQDILTRIDGVGTKEEVYDRIRKDLQL